MHHAINLEITRSYRWLKKEKKCTHHSSKFLVWKQRRNPPAHWGGLFFSTWRKSICLVSSSGCDSAGGADGGGFFEAAGGGGGPGCLLTAGPIPGGGGCPGGRTTPFGSWDLAGGALVLGEEATGGDAVLGGGGAVLFDGEGAAGVEGEVAGVEPDDADPSFFFRSISRKSPPSPPPMGRIMRGPIPPTGGRGLARTSSSGAGSSSAGRRRCRGIGLPNISFGPSSSLTSGAGVTSLNVEMLDSSWLCSIFSRTFTVV